MDLKIKESDLGRFASNYFINEGYEVFKEVVTPFGRIDIVLKKDNLIYGIEIKTSFGLKVMEQAWKNTNYVNYSYVFVPTIKSSFHKKLLTDNGLGLFCINTKATLIEIVKPRFSEKIVNLKLFEEQKTFSEAGNDKSLFFSPFKKTMLNVVEILLNNNNEREISLLVNEAKHHYSNKNSFRISLTNLISKKIIPYLKIVDKKIVLIEGYNLSNLFTRKV
jgi:hypothetical protein